MSDIAIQNQLSKHDLFEAFKRQLIKDFEQSNFSADFAHGLEPDYNHIHQKIVIELKDNEKRTDTSLMNLLYRVDISEVQLKRYLEASTDKDHFNVIAGLIIKRVLQKVVIKQSYRNESQ